MPDDGIQSERYRLWPISGRMLAGSFVIAVITFGIIACYAFVGGYLSPSRLTQDHMIDAFQEVNGIHPGFRRNHAKGVCISGHFDSNGNGVRLSKAAIFRRGSTPVIGRFAVAVGNPFTPDDETEVRSMALRFSPLTGQEWRTGMNDIPVFSVKDANGFLDQLLAGQADPSTGKSDPARMDSFFAAHLESARAMQLIKARPFSTGFANASYNSLNAFRFVNAAGVSTPVRWSMAAVEPFVAAAPGQAEAKDWDYLFDELVARIARGPLKWHLVVTIGQPGDPTDDATMRWPEDREQVEVGTIIIVHIETEAPGNCRDVNFDPLVLPFGIEPSDDPLLSARSAAYSTSFTRRAGEQKAPSQVEVSGTKEDALR